MTLDRLWAGWRMAYVSGAVEAGLEPKDAPTAQGTDASPAGCVFCRILASGEPDEDTYLVWRGRQTAAILNAFPYASGHVLVMPIRHAPDLETLDAEEATELWAAATQAVVAIKGAYQPNGINLGINMGRAAGAGVLGHVHAHVLPRWDGDGNFMTSVAETRVLPEALPDTWKRVRSAWPPGPAGCPS